MPNPKASEKTVARAKTRLGFRLPESYRGFLLAADGWSCFFQDMMIFSTSDPLGGELHKAGQIQLELEECVKVTAAGGVIAADHFTVVASRESIEITLMEKPGTPAEGTVSWVRGEVMQRYDDFLDYYLSMMELNKLDIVDLGRDYGPKPDGVPHIVIDRSGSPPAFEHARRNDL